MKRSNNTVVGVDGKYPAARQPTLYFIGMTTGESSIIKVFPGGAPDR